MKKPQDPHRVIHLRDMDHGDYEAHSRGEPVMWPYLCGVTPPPSHQRAANWTQLYLGPQKCAQLAAPGEWRFMFSRVRKFLRHRKEWQPRRPWCKLCLNALRLRIQIAALMDNP